MKSLRSCSWIIWFVFQNQFVVKKFTSKEKPLIVASLSTTINSFTSIKNIWQCVSKHALSVSTYNVTGDRWYKL